MTRAVRLALVPIAVVALLAVPVGAEEPVGCVDPLTSELVLTEQKTYIHQAETKAGNLGALGVTGLPSWDTTAPTTSVQGGAGGGYLANSANFADPTLAEETGLTVKGAFSGCLDTMLLDLYAFLPTNRTSTSGSTEESPLTVVVNMTVDGEALLSAVEIETTTVPNEGGDATYLARFGISDIHAALVSYGLDPAADHTIEVTAAPRYVNTDNALFVYDTTEVPAGITFNGVPTADYPLITAY